MKQYLIINLKLVPANLVLDSERGAAAVCGLPSVFCPLSSVFKQNKPNFQKAKMDVNIYYIKGYENKNKWTLGENKPNQT